MTRVVRLKSFCIILFLSCVFVTRLSIANEVDAFDSETLFDMSIEKLMEVPIVSASRQEQSIYELSVPVTVISAEDIHYSGLTSIPEILRYAVGVDVTRLDRARYMVGVRGLYSTVSDRTLVLINGRSTLDPIFGTNWMEMPVLIEDIDRIEVVRGPGGAVWGSNAYTGVINIITKKPEDVQGVFSSTTINEFGDSYTHLRYGGIDKKFSWRISAGYEDIENSDEAGAGRMMYKYPSLVGPGGNVTEARDFFRSYKFDTDFGYEISNASKLSFGAAHSNSEIGDRDFLGYFPQENALTSVTRVYAKLDHSFSEDTKGYLQWFGNFAVFNNSYIIRRYAYNENDLECQISFKPGAEHSVSIGGNLRWVHITSDNASTVDESVLSSDMYDEYWAGIYAVDRYKLSDRLTLEGQVRVDRFNKTQTDWSARAAALYGLDAQKRHMLRFAFGRSFRAGSTSHRELNVAAMDMSFPIGTLFNVSSLGGDLNNENIYSLEAGYVGRFSDDVTLRVDTFYQRMEHLIGAVNTLEYVLGIIPVTTTQLVNTGGANAYGIEAELKTKLGNNSTLSAWYSYNEIDFDEHAQIVRAFKPARHKTGLLYRRFVGKSWVFNLNYSNSIFSTAYEAASTGDAQYSPFNETETINRLDLSVSRKFLQGDGELMIGVTDVLNKTAPAASDYTNFTGYETPGRCFFVRVQVSF